MPSAVCLPDISWTKGCSMNSYKTVKELGEYRFEDRKSLFIGYAKPVSNEEDATSFVAQVKKKYPDARHWVYAYVLRENSAMRYSDDREPQGTAGMPVLDAIRKNGLTDTVIVVVRYFGGVLLGTGGLVHAYTEAALGALKAASIIEYNMYTYLSITTTYSDYQKIGASLSEAGFESTDAEYTENVRTFGSVASENYDDLTKKLAEITSGRCRVEFIEEKFDFRE